MPQAKLQVGICAVAPLPGTQLADACMQNQLSSFLLDLVESNRWCASNPAMTAVILFLFGAYYMAMEGFQLYKLGASAYFDR